MSVTARTVAREFAKHFGAVKARNKQRSMVFRELQLSLKPFLEARQFLAKFGNNEMAFDESDLATLFAQVARKVWKSPDLLCEARKGDLSMLCVKEVYNLQQAKAAERLKRMNADEDDDKATVHDEGVEEMNDEDVREEEEEEAEEKDDNATTVCDEGDDDARDEEEEAEETTNNDDDDEEVVVFYSESEADTEYDGLGLQPFAAILPAGEEDLQGPAEEEEEEDKEKEETQQTTFVVREEKDEGQWLDHYLEQRKAYLMSLW